MSARSVGTGAAMRTAATVLLGAVALSLPGCLPSVPTQDFLARASYFALNPDVGCEELKLSFGVPFLPNVNAPDQIGLAYEEAYVGTFDGQSLRVWYIPAAADRGLVVFSMGSVGQMACYLAPVYILANAGYSVVMYEYQGFGGSSGVASLDTPYYDLDAVLPWALQRTGHSQATLMGVSLGTIPSVAQAALHPERVNAVILDSPISLRFETERYADLLDGRPGRFFAQFDPTMRLEELITAVYQPMLVFHYGNDEWNTESHVNDLLSITPAPVTEEYFPFLPHARGPYTRPVRYAAALGVFMDTVWTTPELATADE